MRIAFHKNDNDGSKEKNINVLKKNVNFNLNTVANTGYLKLLP